MRDGSCCLDLIRKLLRSPIFLAQGSETREVFLTISALTSLAHEFGKAAENLTARISFEKMKSAHENQEGSRGHNQSPPSTCDLDRSAIAALRNSETSFSDIAFFLELSCTLAIDGS